MMARRGVLGLLSGGVVALLGGCGLFGGASYRFRLTVQVATPQGLRSGSSVYQVTAGKTLGILPEEHKRDWSVKGEAVAVGLPNGNVLFSLLRTNNPMRQDLALMSMAALDPAFRNDVVESANRIATGNGTLSRAEVSREDWPMMVRFRDINDPKTVEQVDPDAVGVKRILLETTRDEVTTGIQTRLRWLRDPGQTLDPGGGASFSPTPPLSKVLRQEMFKSGEWK